MPDASIPNATDGCKTLLDLAARCEAATGPNRKLDSAIAYWTGHRPWDIRPPRYTASLDAAMTLVPDEYRWTISYGQSIDAKDYLCAVVPPDDYAGKGYRGTTAALALTAAALRARAAMT